MKTLILLLLLAGLLLAAMYLVGCGRAISADAPQPTSRLGAVRFRHETLGGVSNPRISPSTESVNGVQASAPGEFTLASEQSVALEDSGNHRWAPKSVTQLV